MARQHRLHQRGLAGATRPGEQHVVGRQALYEMAGVGINELSLRLDAPQIGQGDAMRMQYRFEYPLGAAPPPAERHVSREVGRRRAGLE